MIRSCSPMNIRGIRHSRKVWRIQARTYNPPLFRPHLLPLRLPIFLSWMRLVVRNRHWRRTRIAQHGLPASMFPAKLFRDQGSAVFTSAALGRGTFDCTSGGPRARYFVRNARNPCDTRKNS